MPHGIRIKFTRNRIVLDFGWWEAGKSAFCLLLIFASIFVPLPGNETSGQRIAFVLFITAASLWLTEIIPPFATAIVIIVLSVYLLGDLVHPETGHEWEKYLNPVASPVLVLFFGGFFLAMAATKHGFDVRLARAFITPFGNRPSMLLLGIILTTALFSMFMSNTATTAMMIAIMGPVFHNLTERPQTRKMVVLAVPFAANLGGMGSIIGTPPNAVAASVLHQIDGGQHAVTFVGWMLMTGPIVIVLLFMLWFVLLRVFRPKPEPLEISFPEVVELTPALLTVVAVFTVTVSMWLTQPLHGIPSAVVALLPIGLFPVFGIIDQHDLKRIDWDILILVAGGMTLGVAMSETGLSALLVSAIPFEDLPREFLLSLAAVVALVLSNFMSNTSASNMLIPIITSVSAASPRMGAMVVALSCSMAMSLPISTPPNAIAFATREVTTADIARYGTLVSGIGLVIVLTAILLIVG
ncbi:MAG: SLC13 family permease [Phycisphaerae bacterium]